MHGTGEYTYSNGTIISGKWHKGTIEGKATLTFPIDKDGHRKVYNVICKDRQFSCTDANLPPFEFPSYTDIQFDC